MQDNQALLHSTVTPVPLPMAHPTTSSVSGADTMQTSDTSASSQAKVNPVAGNPPTLSHLGNNTLTQPHKMPGGGATTLGGSVVNNGPAGLSGSSVNNNNPTAPSPLAPGQATILPGTGSVLTSLGNSNQLGTSGPTGIGHSTISGGGTLSANANTNANSNLVGPAGGLVPNQLGPSAVAPLQVQPGAGPIPVSGAGQAQNNNPLGVIAGMGGATSALATPGVNAVVNAMPPTTGLAQPVQPGQQPLGPPQGINAVVTPPQQPSGALKYTKLWEVGKCVRISV